MNSASGLAELVTTSTPTGVAIGETGHVLVASVDSGCGRTQVELFRASGGGHGGAEVLRAACPGGLGAGVGSAQLALSGDHWAAVGPVPVAGPGRHVLRGSLSGGPASTHRLFVVSFDGKEPRLALGPDGLAYVAGVSSQRPAVQRVDLASVSDDIAPQLLLGSENLATSAQPTPVEVAVAAGGALGLSFDLDGSKTHILRWEALGVDPSLLVRESQGAGPSVAATVTKATLPSLGQSRSWGMGARALVAFAARRLVFAAESVAASPDGGPRADVGPSLDAGEPTDAGVAPDAAGEDAGVPGVDAAMLSDGGFTSRFLWSRRLPSRVATEDTAEAEIEVVPASALTVQVTSEDCWADLEPIANQAGHRLRVEFLGWYEHRSSHRCEGSISDSQGRSEPFGVDFLGPRFELEVANAPRDDSPWLDLSIANASDVAWPTDVEFRTTRFHCETGALSLAEPEYGAIIRGPVWENYSHHVLLPLEAPPWDPATSGCFLELEYRTVSLRREGEWQPAQLSIPLRKIQFRCEPDLYPDLYLTFPPEFWTDSLRVVSWWDTGEGDSVAKDERDQPVGFCCNTTQLRMGPTGALLDVEWNQDDAAGHQPCPEEPRPDPLPGAGGCSGVGGCSQHRGDTQVPWVGQVALLTLGLLRIAVRRRLGLR